MATNGISASTTKPSAKIKNPPEPKRAKRTQGEKKGGKDANLDGVLLTNVKSQTPPQKSPQEVLLDQIKLQQGKGTPGSDDAVGYIDTAISMVPRKFRQRCLENPDFAVALCRSVAGLKKDNDDLNDLHLLLKLALRLDFENILEKNAGDDFKAHVSESRDAGLKFLDGAVKSLGLDEGTKDVLALSSLTVAFVTYHFKVDLGEVPHASGIADNLMQFAQAEGILKPVGKGTQHAQRATPDVLLALSLAALAYAAQNPGATEMPKKMKKEIVMKVKARRSPKAKINGQTPTQDFVSYFAIFLQTVSLPLPPPKPTPMMRIRAALGRNVQNN